MRRGGEGGLQEREGTEERKAKKFDNRRSYLCH
jgi:hypothetical protein